MDTKTLAERIAAQFIAGETPEALKKHQFTKNDPDNPNPKGNDRDGDGKTNEKKPDFLDKKAGCEKLPEGGMRDNCEKKSKGKSDSDEKKASIVPVGVVAALTFDGQVKVFEASTPEAADGIKKALQACEGEYASIVHGPNKEGRTASELYAHFEERWFEAGCEKLPAGGMRDNCEKKSKGGDSDSKSDDKSDDKKDDKGGKPPWLNKKKSHDMTAASVASLESDLLGLIEDAGVGSPKDKMTMKMRSLWFNGSEVLIYPTTNRGDVINVDGKEYKSAKDALRALMK